MFNPFITVAQTVDSGPTHYSVYDGVTIWVIMQEHLISSHLPNGYGHVHGSVGQLQCIAIKVPKPFFCAVSEACYHFKAHMYMYMYIIIVNIEILPFKVSVYIICTLRQWPKTEECTSG